MVFVIIRLIYVGFTVCRTKRKKCKGPKWGGLLPISSFGSRHCSGVATIGATECTTGVPARMTEGLRECTRACLGRPVATGFLEDPLSRQRRLTLCLDRGDEKLGVCVAT